MRIAGEGSTSPKGSKAPWNLEFECAWKSDLIEIPLKVNLENRVVLFTCHGLRQHVVGALVLNSALQVCT